MKGPQLIEHDPPVSSGNEFHASFPAYIAHAVPQVPRERIMIWHELGGGSGGKDGLASFERKTPAGYGRKRLKGLMVIHGSTSCAKL
jgi:hypothetical protein